jgi:DMSO/TMAO reductase YedYZ molybdopterin-dependent catalytic subunit
MTSSRPLPPGQRAREDFPGFGKIPDVERFAKRPPELRLLIGGDVGERVEVAEALAELPRVEQVSDFHCVTTWSHRGVRWSGWRFADFYERIVVPRARPEAGAEFVVLRCADGYRASMRLEDLLAGDVMLADRLGGEALPLEHGAPLRLVAPAHYGYKNAKHLKAVEFRRSLRDYRPAVFRFMEHPRARVAPEERSRGLPGWIYRYLYRPAIAPIVRRHARAMERLRASLDPGPDGGA